MTRRPPALDWLRQAALMPWWLLQLASSAKSFADNPLIGSRWLNAHGLHTRRLQLAHHLTWARRQRLAQRISAEDRAAFERDGFVLHRNALPQALFERLRDRLLQHAAPAREMVQGDTVTRRIALDGSLTAAIPELHEALQLPRWQGLTRYVAGYDQPPWAYVQTILSQVRPADPDPQTRLHSDTFHPTMKAWLFLTDVAEDEGPFCYVPGSHQLSPQRLAWERQMSLVAASHPDRMTARGSFRIEAAELPALGLPPPRQFAVPANTLVVADTFGFHARGPSLRPSTRIELWGYDRRNPFLPWSTDGLLSLLGRQQDGPLLYWQWLDRVEKHLGHRNAWRNTGLRTPGSPADRDANHL